MQISLLLCKLYLYREAKCFILFMFVLNDSTGNFLIFTFGIISKLNSTKSQRIAAWWPGSCIFPPKTCPLIFNFSERIKEDRAASRQPQRDQSLCIRNANGSLSALCGNPQSPPISVCQKYIHKITRKWKNPYQIKNTCCTFGCNVNPLRSKWALPLSSVGCGLHTWGPLLWREELIACYFNEAKPV